MERINLDNISCVKAIDKEVGEKIAGGTSLGFAIAQANPPGSSVAIGDAIAAAFPGPGLSAAIFKCGGDFHEDGTCNDVIASCVTIDLEFECNKYDEQGVCVNGGC